MNPECASHPGIQAVGQCATCRYPFCQSCLVEFQGAWHCVRCRDYLWSQGQLPQAPQPPSFSDHLIPTKNLPALIGYYVSVASLIPCFALIAGPAAILLGIVALRARAANPNLPGRTHALVAVVLGSITTLANLGFILFLILKSRTG